MTPSQYYFPYFFQIETFNEELKRFDLSSYVKYDTRTQTPDNLMVIRNDSKEILLSIPFRATLMVKEDKLLYWNTDYDLIDLTQVQLDNLNEPIKHLNVKLDLSKLKTGHNSIETKLDLEEFVTFVRREDLTYAQYYYERFAIVIINGSDIHIIPFDWFNKINGEYGYVWPATARLDIANRKLYGQGIRMRNFSVELEKSRA